MKAGALLDAASAAALGLTWLSAAVEPAGPYGDRTFQALSPFAPGQEAQAQARAQGIADLAATVGSDRLDAVRETLRGMPDAANALARASMGDVLGDANFLELQRFCDAAQRIDALLSGASVPLAASEAVRAVARVLESGRSGKFGFYLGDAFDTGMTQARIATSRAQAEFDAARGRAIEEIAQNLGREDISGNEFIVMRSDLRGPLPAGVRVAREAATYLLCELDFDEAILEAMRRRDEAAQRLATAEHEVRSQLTREIASRAALLDAASQALGEIDVLVASARFAQRYSCRVAEIERDTALTFSRGRYLPLEVELQREGRSFTPIDIDLSGMAVLTGPNMGGKSVCLRTCGFIALCAAFGLPVPADRARASLFDDIAWLGIGPGADDGDELGGLLSSFAREVVHLRDVLQREAGRRLVFIDEFARTTTPHEGKALLVSLLAELRRRGAFGVVATHLSGIAAEAGVRHLSIRGLRAVPAREPEADLHAALAALADSMDYTIVELGADGEPPSDAIALAALLGLDESLIARARESLEGDVMP